jgi:hypothetical protein
MASTVQQAGRFAVAAVCLAVLATAGRAQSDAGPGGAAAGRPEESQVFEGLTDGASEGGPPDGRAAVPERAAQEEALRVLKDVFAEEYGKEASADRLAFAARLLERAGEAGNDDATHYVMLREARDIAAGAGDVGAALAAAGAIADAFEVADPIALKLAALAAASRKPTDAAQSEALVRAHLAVSGEALIGGDINRAIKVVALAEPIARKVKGSESSARLGRRKKELKEVQSRFGSATGAARETLRKTPDDAAANVTMGRFYCLAAGNWEVGLPMLAKGDDQALRKLARDDLAGGGRAPAGMVTIGDNWWQLGERQAAGLARAHARQRAAHWYARAVGDVTGLQRTRIEKRLEAVEAASAAASGSGGGDYSPQLLDVLARKMPPDVRALVSVDRQRADANNALSSELRGTPVELVATVKSLNERVTNGRTQLNVISERIGPVKVGGAEHYLTVTLVGDTPDEIARLRTLPAGSGVQLRGLIATVGLVAWKPKEGEVTELTFHLTFQDGLHMAPAARRP